MTAEDEIEGKKRKNIQAKQLTDTGAKIEQKCATKGHTENAQKKGKWREQRRGNCQLETYCTVHQDKKEITHLEQAEEE